MGHECAYCKVKVGGTLTYGSGANTGQSLRLMQTRCQLQEGDLELRTTGPCLPSKGLLWPVALSLSSLGPGRAPRPSSYINYVCPPVE